MAANIQTLSSFSCVLKANFPNAKLESSSCGTVIDPLRGIVISHGSILAEYCTDNQSLPAKVKDGKLLTSKDFPDSHFSLLLSNDLLSVQSFKNAENQNALVTMGTSSSVLFDGNITKEDGDTSCFKQVKCRFIGGFRNDDFHKTMTKMMPKTAWTFTDLRSDEVENSDVTVTGAITDKYRQDNKQNVDDFDLGDITYHLLSYFLLFRFNCLDLQIANDSLFGSNHNSQPPSMLKSGRGRCFIGETAEIIATPFASLCPDVFFNGYSRGVISNVAGVNNCWIVSDARCIPGCEGGPLYTKRKPTDEDSFLTGIITSPLCWKNNEWVGFSVACSIDSIVKSITQYQEVLPSGSHKYLTSATKENSPLVKKLLKFQAMTVLVQCGSTWGTGVIVDRDKGVILTCSHVIKGAGHCSVTVTASKSTIHYRGQVIYRQEPVQTAYDLAVIKCPQATKHLPRSWCISVEEAFVGKDILLSGHAVFGTDRNLEPSICQGVVSKVIRIQGKPVMVQTTCAVHAGSSGGPLLTSDGHLVGIVVCNTRDSVSNTSFPHVNLCIPIWTVWPVIHNYIHGRDKEGLSQLQVKDTELNKLWALGVQSSHETEAVPVTTSKL